MNWDDKLERAVACSVTPLPLKKKESVREQLNQLATLDALDFELRRDGEARALGIRVSVLDKKLKSVGKRHLSTMSANTLAKSSRGLIRSRAPSYLTIS